MLHGAITFQITDGIGYVRLNWWDGTDNHVSVSWHEPISPNTNAFEVAELFNQHHAAGIVDVVHCGTHINVTTRPLGVDDLWRIAGD